MLNSGLECSPVVGDLDLRAGHRHGSKRDTPAASAGAATHSDDGRAYHPCEYPHPKKVGRFSCTCRSRQILEPRNHCRLDAHEWPPDEDRIEASGKHISFINGDALQPGNTSWAPKRARILVRVLRDYQATREVVARRARVRMSAVIGTRNGVPMAQSHQDSVGLEESNRKSDHASAAPCRCHALAGSAAASEVF